MCFKENKNSGSKRACAVVYHICKRVNISASTMLKATKCLCLTVRGSNPKSHMTLWSGDLISCVPTLLLVCFFSLKESTCETRKNVFCFFSKVLFILEKIKVKKFRHWNFITVAMVTKIWSMVTDLGWLLPTKSHDPLIMWSAEITLQTKTIISPLGQFLWPPNLTVWWLVLRGSYSQSYMTFWSHDFAKWRDKLKSVYIFHHSV